MTKDCRTIADWCHAPEQRRAAVSSPAVRPVNAIDAAGLVALCVLMLCVGCALAAWAFRVPL